MSKKKPKSHQSSNAPVGNGDSSDSNEVNDKTNGTAQNSFCHSTKAVNFNQVVKGLKNGDDLRKNYCQICVKDSKPLQGDSIFVCLRCGTKTCCKEHSNAHSRVLRSDVHSLAYDHTSQILWCHGCSSEINERDLKNKKVATCVMSLKRQMLNFTPKEKTNAQVLKPAASQTQNEEEAPRNAVGKNGKKGKPGNVYQSVPSVPVRGLSNLGNTCYFNSVMQCLARTQPLLAELKGTDHPTDIRLELKGADTLEGRLTSWDQMTECLYETLTTLLSPGSAYVPSKFLNLVRKKHPQFEGYDQHDAHELLRHTLDSIRMLDLRRYQRLMLAKKNLASNVNPKDVPQETQKQLKELEHKVTQAQTFVPEHTFKGKLVSRVECQDCHHSSEYIEGFLDLSLPILADKPHPPTARRKTGAVATTPEPASENYTHMSAKARRQQKKLARQIEKNEKRQKDSGANGGEVDEVAIEAHEADEQEELLNMEEDKPHESGYSSEKASSSLRGSPSSEEVRSSSPCDDSWAAVPHHTETWLSALSAGVQFPLQQQREPNHNYRPPTYIPLHADGTPDLAHLSLHDSVGSTLNPLCLSTASIMEQELDWRERIHERYFSSVPESEESNDARVKSSETEHPPVENPDLVGADSSSIIPEPSSNVHAATPVRDPSPCREEPASDDRAPDVSVVDGRKVSGVTGRAATPPLRKIRSPLVKRETGISPVCEEESGSPPEPLSTIEEISPIKPPYLNPETAAPVPDEDSLDYVGPHGSIVKALDTMCKEFVRESKEKLEKTHSGNLSFGSSSSDPDLSMSLRPLDDTSEQQDENSADWSTFRNTFSCPKNAAPSMRRDGGSEGKQSAPNNSLDSEGNESGNEKTMIAFVQEIDELPNEQVDEIPPNSVVNSQEDSPSIEKPNDAIAEEKVEVVNQKLPSSEEGDFEPLLSTVPNNPQLSFETPEIKIWANDMDEFFKERFAEYNSLKKKDSRDPSECSVESCLRQFTAIELMNGSNKVGCSVCTDRQNKGNKDGKTVLTMATKQLLIGQAPPVLILHLKRFQVQLRSFRKLTKHVSFPLILDVSPFCSSIGEDKNKFSIEEPKLYSLYGIVEHRGTLNSGHYVAYIKVDEDDKRRWFCISDSHVDEVTEERILKAEAYLLFYSKITLPFS